ncbi:hypothetical protein BJV82DRAFT_616131 [Fennellomyces sp. T-0311]|nr:hypothetical protein BJV82DRAFT_616131 [Fennellomyces sp. T-0311]
MNWSPESSTEEKLETLSNASSRTAQSRLRPPSRFSSSGHRIKTQRSDSLSSENSLTSQSTITTGGGYARYGMTPMIYPSESTTSNSSRSHSRLSDYSASSSQASSNATSIPRANSRASSIPNSNSNSTGSGLRRETSEFRSSSRIGGGNGSRLAKRATHVPLPSTRSAPKPQLVTSSRSTGLSSTRLPSRASHIPAPRNVASPEPRSPTLSPARSNIRPRSPFTTSNSRMGIRSPTPTGGPRNSVFGSSPEARRGDKVESNNNSNSNNNNNSRIARPPSAAGKTRPTGLRPPSAIGKVSNRRGAT